MLLSNLVKSLVNHQVPEDSTEGGLTMRLFDYWERLHKTGDLPSRKYFRIEAIPGLAEYGFALSLSHGDDPLKFQFVGTKLKEYVGVDLTEANLSETSDNTLISEVMKRFGEVLEYQAPVAFDTEFIDSGGSKILYQAVMLPLGEDNSEIDFVVGAITRKEQKEELSETTSAAPADETDVVDSTDDLLFPEKMAPSATGGETDADPVTADREIDQSANGGETDADPVTAEREIDQSANDGETDADPISSDQARNLPAFGTDASVKPATDEQAPDQLADGPEPVTTDHEADRPTDGADSGAAQVASERGDLTRSLGECRELASTFRTSETNSRAALYETLEGTYWFHFEALTEPESYAALCASSGIKQHSRAPFTAVIKLIFGQDCDKTRISEYAACLSYAKRTGQQPGALRGLIEATEGGVKGCVKAERAARRAERQSEHDKYPDYRDLLRKLTPLAELTGQTGGGEEFVLLLARRSPAGSDRLQVLCPLDEKPSLLESIIKRAAKALSAQLKPEQESLVSGLVTGSGANEPDSADPWRGADDT